MSSKFHLSKWKTCFSQFIDKLLKIEELEYLIHYVKFKMWPALLYVYKLPVSPSIFNVGIRLYIISPNLKRLKTGILNVALGRDFQFFPNDERDKKLEFSRLGSVS